MVEPPQNLAAERAVLACMLADPSAIPNIENRLIQNDFFRAGNGKIYAAMLRLHWRGETPDLVTVVHELRSTGNLEAAGGPQAVAALLEVAASPKNIEAYGRQVLDAAVRRAASRAGAELAEAAADPMREIDSLMAEMQQKANIIDVQIGSHAKGPTPVRDGLAEIFTGQEQPHVPLGLECLRSLEVTPGRLCTIAARPGKGKTAMLGTISLAAARAGWNVLFFSLEMTGLEIRQRLLSGFSGIKLDDVVHRRDPRLAAEASALAELPIWIQDESTARLDVEAICSAVRKFDARPCVVVIDYLQLVGTRLKFDRRYEAIGHVCRELKHLALRANVPVIVAAQLSRAAEERSGKPQLSDLRESGEIEQTSNQVLLMHRGDDPAQTDLKVAKNRHGPSYTTACYFRGETCMFEDS